MTFSRAALAEKAETAGRYHANLTGEVYEYLAGRGIDKETAERYKLGVCDDIYNGRLAIPYLRPSGVIHFNYRALNGETPKYIGPGAKHLFNTADLDAADQEGEIAIAEGELDALVASSVFSVPCVGIPGATQWTGNKHWRELFTGYQRVWILADPDEAGLALASAIMDDLPMARLVKLPGDVTETMQAGHDLREFMQ
jgi:5S rRNA maturation endonuclease (ribonuclease M5)